MYLYRAALADIDPVGQMHGDLGGCGGPGMREWIGPGAVAHKRTTRFWNVLDACLPQRILWRRQANEIHDVCLVGTRK